MNYNTPYVLRYRTAFGQPLLQNTIGVSTEDDPRTNVTRKGTPCFYNGNSCTDKCKNSYCSNKTTVRLSYQHCRTRYTCTSKKLHCIAFVSDGRFSHLFHKSYRRRDHEFVRNYGLIIETQGGFHYPAIRSPIECSTLCLTNDACSSFNFNIQNSTCEIVHSVFVALPWIGQMVSDIPRTVLNNRCTLIHNYVIIMEN